MYNTKEKKPVMFSHDNWGNKKLPRGGKRDKDRCDQKILENPFCFTDPFHNNLLHMFRMCPGLE